MTSVLYRLLCNRIGGYSCQLNVDRTIPKTIELNSTAHNSTKQNIKLMPMPINGTARYYKTGI